MSHIPHQNARVKAGLAIERWTMPREGREIKMRCGANGAYWRGKESFSGERRASQRTLPWKFMRPSR